ncbi:adenylate/guanylate cyclase domain-containing protein [Roseibacterium sp. SDUM158017]|uniref:adenylate/guanylate cyclase domain-containing protein n=1 Tax=Roseicyclus salinarum TaxID=3036773 RepID=UPI0024153A63|nr:adenylate/guanylate cyclase domain-containing protein [Roseibacterium sp. SDUM158017]MDG4648183.1 adenylate/guanylate cyclase domain-containing protein [Roseibacterium sp. SDUM158017]
MGQVDLAWVLLCSILVFVMRARFACIEAGIIRAKDNISVAMKNIPDFALSVILFCVLGYGLMFGAGSDVVHAVGGGSALGMTDAVLELSLNTVVSGAGGVLTGLDLAWAIDREASIFHGMNGGLAVLVVVTAAGGLVGLRVAMVIGVVAGCIALFGDRLHERLRIDDMVRAVRLHFMAGLRVLVAVALSGFGALTRHVETTGRNVWDHGAIAVDGVQEFLFETRQAGRQTSRDLQARVAIHSGPLVAGVVGELRFIHDVRGMTVNIARRIEEAGKTGKISVSHTVIGRIGDEFVDQRQARVCLKGGRPTILHTIEGGRIGVARKSGRAPDALTGA